MPDSVVVFTPKAERDAAENLGEFVAVSRSQLTISVPIFVSTILPGTSPTPRG